jgi:Right handed beta helix region
VLSVLSFAVAATEVAADPMLVPGSDIGAALPVATVAKPQVPDMPPAPRVSGGACRFQFSSPPPVPVKHVAPCGGAAGTGAANNPWGSLKQALALLKPGDVAYVHDDPSRGVDYAEYDLTPTADGTGAPCAGSAAAPARIRLMAAPGEGMPVVKKPADAALAKPLLRLSKSWWLVEGLRFSGARVERHSVVVITAGCVVMRRVEITGAGQSNASVAISDAKHVALLRNLIWQPVTGDATTGRPATVPTTNQDHHGVTVSNASDRVLVRSNHSHGHNGDSVQCGEIDDDVAPSDPDPANLTIEGNRFHQDEENAIDLKRCVRVTIRENKLYGYYPARPYRLPNGSLANRAPQGDAIVVHHNRLEGAERVLIERNRLFRNSRAINLGSKVSRVVVRRNVIFGARQDRCGIGAGIAVEAQQIEIYHNTLDVLPAPITTPGSNCPTTWSASQRAAIRLSNQSSSTRPVLWNNIVSHAFRHLAMSISASVLDARRNLFDAAPSIGTPFDSLIGDPKFVADPATNDYFTQPGSPARDAAAPVPASVLDPATYCDDPGDPDTNAEPDIGFLETC